MNITREQFKKLAKKHLIALDGLGTVESVEINEYNQTVYLVAHPKGEPFPDGIGGSVARSFWTRGEMRVLSVKEKF